MKKNNRIWIYSLNTMVIFLLSLSISFKSIAQESTVIVKDVDGNVYKTVRIGTQTWMAENLKATKYNNGTPIPLVTTDTEWSNLSTPGYCWYLNDEATYKNIYGALYNWYTVNTKKLCPAGWHVPSDAEWTTLTTYLGGVSVAGEKLRETSTTHWNSPNPRTTNEYNFTALPGGLRDNKGAFRSIGSHGWWWSAQEFEVLSSAANCWFIYCKSPYMLLSADKKEFGLSIRCLKD